MRGAKGLSKSQTEEMKRRSFLIFLYLIRSPFYDCYSKSVLTIVLSQIEQRATGSRYLIGAA